MKDNIFYYNLHLSLQSCLVTFIIVSSVFPLSIQLFRVNNMA